MNSGNIQTSDVMNSILNMNNLLKNISEMEIENTNKMLKMNVTVKVAGLGENIDIYNIEIDREILRDRIAKRTNMMYEMGLIDEVCYLESKYGRKPNSMGAIGIVETLEYLDAKVTKDQMLQNISTHTAQLAKRQQTFNKNQFRQNNVIPHPFQKESIDVR